MKLLETKQVQNFFLIIIFVVVFVSQVSWLKKDTRPPAWDDAHHLRLAVEYGEEFAQGKWKKILSEHYFNYPPLYHWTLALFLSLFERSPDAAGILNLAYTFLLILSVFFLVRFLAKDSPQNRRDSAALLGTCLIMSYPFLMHTLRFPLLDGALTAWSAFTLLALFRCENFSSRKWSILSGIGWGCGMLTKWPFFSYLLFPTLWMALRAGRQNLKNILFFILTFLVVAGPWYYFNWIFVVRRSLILGGATYPGENHPIWSIPSFLYYFVQLPHQLTYGGTALLGIGLLLSLMKREFILPVGSILLPILFWISTPTKDPRYFLPILPAIAVISSLWLRNFFVPLQITVLILCFSQFIFLHFFSLKYPPRKEDWKQQEILSAVIQERKGTSFPNHFSILKTLCHPPYLEQISLRYAAIQNRWYDRIKPQGSPPTNEFFMFTDFVLTQTAGWQEAHRGYKNHQTIQNSQWFRQVFSEIGRWKLPEPNGEAVLYKLNVLPVTDFSLPQLRRLIEQTSVNPGIAFEDLQVEIIPESTKHTSLGKFKSIRVKMREASFRELPLGNVTLFAEDIQLNLPLLKEKGQLRLLQMKSLMPQAKIRAQEIERFSQEQIKKYFSELSVKFENGRIVFVGQSRWKLWVEVVVELKLDEKENCVVQRFEKIKIGWLKIPKFFYRHFTDRKYFLGAGSGMPFDLKIHRLRIDEGKIEIN